jgi:hypothetical protein
MAELRHDAGWQFRCCLERARSRVSVLGRAAFWIAVTSCASVAAPPSAAAAQGRLAAEPQATLSWRAPQDAECSSGEQLRAQVAHLSEQTMTLGDVASPYRIEAIITPNRESWQAQVTMRDARGQTLRSRMVSGRTPSCGSIDVAAAVVIATMLDSLRNELPRSQARTAPPPSASGRGPGLSAFAAINSQLVFDAWLGGGLALELGDDLQLTVSASVYAPGEQKDSRGRGAQLWGFHAGAALCPAVVRGNIIDLHVCAGAQGGAVLASGVGLTRQNDATVPLALALAGPKVTLMLSRTFAVQLAASAAWAFVRPKVLWSDADGDTEAVPGSKIALLMQLGVTISPW